tara:strand:- start:20111 stop:21619 length:1509 start_codon:yes stop_codon:yes gene_type:complete
VCLINSKPLRILKYFCNYILIIFSNSYVFTQSSINTDNIKEISHFNRNELSQNLLNNTYKSKFNFSFNINTIGNSGHSNIDNNAELYSHSKSTNLLSTRLEYSTPWLSLSLEPYTISYNGSFTNAPAPGTYNENNNHSFNNSTGKTKIGLRQSSLVLHYNGVGIGYGNMSHWWGPGFHSALALTNNAPSQETYVLGTFKDIKVGNFSFGSQIIAMPYKSKNGTQLYFSGLKAHISHHSDHAIITLGLHRTYLSGDFENLSTSTVSAHSWSLLDAAKLVIEPLFGQRKKDLSYTQPGTPGFDAWDELLTGFAKLSFPKLGLSIYGDVASDDNRGNLTDLWAHWDHTLGYQLGMTKNTKLDQYNIFTGIEFLTTRVSNTFNPKFYRGGESPNYYAKPIYDYFTYQGRRMGAHSGSSSDDLIFMLGLDNETSTTLLSFNKERHGIKSMTHPEHKTEYVFTYHRRLTSHQTAFITLEYEKIKNFGFIQDNISVSKLVWLGYSFTIN